MVVSWLEFVLCLTEDGVEEATGGARLRDSLAHRERRGVFFQCGRLSNVELRPVSLEAIAEVESVADGVTKINAEVYNRRMSASPCPRRLGQPRVEGVVHDYAETRLSQSGSKRPQSVHEQQVLLWRIQRARVGAVSFPGRIRSHSHFPPHSVDTQEGDRRECKSHLTCGARAVCCPPWASRSLCRPSSASCV